MIDSALLSAQSFADARYELPDAGQWSELIRGRVEIFSPPDDEHRVAVLNLSKAFGEYVTQHVRGYACFDLGLILARDPDTVRFPAVSYFLGGEMFAESDKDQTETRPALVVEIASSNDRRRTLNDRIYDYDRWGVEVMWIVDPLDKALHIIRPGYPNKALRDDEMLLASPTWKHRATNQLILPEFRLPVSQLFVAPDEWQ